MSTARTHIFYRSKWILRLACLFLAASLAASLTSNSVAYMFLLIAIPMLAYITFDMFRKSQTLGPEKAIRFTLRVAGPSILMILLVLLVIRHG